jgi:hypothetical protein
MVNKPATDSGHGRHRHPKTTYTRLGLALAVPVGAVLLGFAAAGPASADGVQPFGSAVIPTPVAVNGTGTAISGTDNNRDLCLDDRYSNPVDYNPVQVYDCNGTQAQQWTFDSTDDTVQDFGMCLDVYSGGTWDGDSVDLYQCNGTGAQVWIPYSDGSVYNPQSGKCLDDTDAGGSGTQLQIWDCVGDQNQFWLLPGLVYEGAGS